MAAAQALGAVAERTPSITLQQIREKAEREQKGMGMGAPGVYQKEEEPAEEPKAEKGSEERLRFRS